MKEIHCWFDFPPPPSSHAQLYDSRELSCHEYVQHGLAFHKALVISWYQINAKPWLYTDSPPFSEYQKKAAGEHCGDLCI